MTWGPPGSEEFRKYHREWMRTKRAADPEFKARQLALVRARKAARRQLLATIKLERGCIDCGYRSESRFLQFDHRDPSAKSFTISNQLMKPLEIVMAEVAKCDVRCASCHEIRSAAERHNVNRRFIEVADST
jgi:hypothetical protein